MKISIGAEFSAFWPAQDNNARDKKPKISAARRSYSSELFFGKKNLSSFLEK